MKVTKNHKIGDGVTVFRYSKVFVTPSLVTSIKIHDICISKQRILSPKYNQVGRCQQRKEVE